MSHAFDHLHGGHFGHSHLPNLELAPGPHAIGTPDTPDLLEPDSRHFEPSGARECLLGDCVIVSSLVGLYIKRAHFDV